MAQINGLVPRGRHQRVKKHGSPEGRELGLPRRRPPRIDSQYRDPVLLFRHVIWLRTDVPRRVALLAKFKKRENVVDVDQNRAGLHVLRDFLRVDCFVFCFDVRQDDDVVFL